MAKKDRIFIFTLERKNKRLLLWVIWTTVNNSLDTKREAKHISDDKRHIVQIYGDVMRYQIDNHLGSSAIELDENANLISYEEYHPFGTTSYRSGRSAAEVSLKRYRYVAKEKDKETGLYYYGMRYYDASIAKFISVDPLALDYLYYTPYQYAGNKPISYIDLDGAEPSCFQKMTTDARAQGLRGIGWSETQISKDKQKTAKTGLIVGGLSIASYVAAPAIIAEIGFIGKEIIVPASVRIFSWVVQNPTLTTEIGIGVISAGTGYDGPEPNLPINKIRKLALKSIEEGVEISGLLFRGADDLPSKIAKEGFKAWGVNTSVFDHIWQFGKKNSFFVPTSKTGNVAKIFATTYNGGGYVYVINATNIKTKTNANSWIVKNGYDVMIDNGILIDYRWQNEVLIPIQVSNEKILGAFKINEQGNVIGKFINLTKEK